MTDFGIAGLQLELSHCDNLKSIEEEVQTTVHLFPWVKMIVLSELCSFGSNPDKAQSLKGKAYATYSKLAKDHQIYLVTGSYFVREGDHTYNTSLVFDPRGTEIARYAKMFPFEPYETGITPGTDFCLFEIPDVGKFGLSICYDMWFPETTRTLAWMGAEVILHPTMTGTIDRDAEISIARASAVTNQVYFFDINGAGKLGNGRSAIISPEGDVLHQAGSGREIIPLNVNFDYLRKTRKNGLKHLGQPLKSFRDNKLQFPPYQKGAQSPSLDALGPIEKPSHKPS